MNRSTRAEGNAAPVAELIADRGEAAAAEEFFRSRPYLDAEGVTHTLRIETATGELLVPLVVRSVGSSEDRDASSPYGYPGAAFLVSPGSSAPADRAERDEGTRGDDSEPIDPADVDFSATGLISLFVRHTLGEPPLARSRERNIVQIADPKLPPKRRSSDRNQINKNLRNGYEVSIVPAAEASAEERAGFLTAYEETMRRTGASERYFFGDAYFARIFESEVAWLALARAPGGTIAAGSAAVQSDGFIHYYLSGSADAHLRDSPMKNVVAALVEFASVRGLPLNLGGGITPGDPLEEFKRGFANRQEPWRTSEIVCDPDAYARLSSDVWGSDPPPGDFFPAYRASR